MRHTDPAYWESLMRMGLTKLFMLHALAEGPAHGYALARRTEELSASACKPTAGTIYPVLQEWEREGLVVSFDQVVQGRARKVYTLTAAGRSACEAAAAVWTGAARSVLALEPAKPDRLPDHLL